MDNNDKSIDWFLHNLPSPAKSNHTLLKRPSVQTPDYSGISNY